MIYSLSAKRILLVSIYLILCCAFAFAFQFSPMEQDFETSGVNAQKSYTIVNDSDEDIAIRISIVPRDQNENGEELRGESSSEFIITPSQVIVRARSAYVVRVRYRGPSTVAVEKPYRLIAEQVSYNPGKSDSNTSMFNFLYVYVTSLYVKPSKIIESVSVKQIAASYDEYGNKIMSVTLENTGNVHQILINASLKVTDFNGNSIVLETLGLLGAIDSMNLLARKTVTKTIPWHDSLEFSPTGTYKGTLTYTN